MTIWKSVLAVLALAIVVGVASLDEADAANCTWICNQTIDTDPEVKDIRDAGSLPNVIPTSSYTSWILKAEVTAGTPIPTWAYRYIIDTDDWEISAKCGAYSYTWGFASVSDSSSGAGQFVITRPTSCPTPADDIELTVRQQFHAEAALNADEKCEVVGRLRFWCAKTISTMHGPAAVDSLAQGGVSIDDDYSSSQETVSVSAFGVTISLTAGDSGSDTDDPTGEDNGQHGTCPETINTSTNVAVTMDLDSYDSCSGEINQVWWHVNVVATCKGACANSMIVLHKNTYP